jgi:hypothetical protein
VFVCTAVNTLLPAVHTYTLPNTTCVREHSEQDSSPCPHNVVPYRVLCSTAVSVVLYELYSYRYSTLEAVSSSSTATVTTLITAAVLARNVGYCYAACANGVLQVAVLRCRLVCLCIYEHSCYCACDTVRTQQGEHIGTLMLCFLYDD